MSRLIGVDAPPPTLQDASLKRLRLRINEQVEEQLRALALGSATQGEYDKATTAEKYAAQVSYIKALRDVLELANEIDRELYGDKPLGEQ